MRGRPLRATNAEDQCEAVTFETDWKRRNKTDLRCIFFARVIVNKKRLCLRHAHMEALALLVKDGGAQPILRPQTRIPYQPVTTVGEKREKANANAK